MVIEKVLMNYSEVDVKMGFACLKETFAKAMQRRISQNNLTFLVKF